jgi:hypothetical protein
MANHRISEPNAPELTSRSQPSAHHDDPFSDSRRSTATPASHLNYPTAGQTQPTDAGHVLAYLRGNGRYQRLAASMPVAQPATPSPCVDEHSGWG